MEVGEEPIRKRNKYYPKDFTPGSIITRKIDQKNTSSRYQFNQQSQTSEDNSQIQFTHQIAIQTYTEKPPNPQQQQNYFQDQKPLIKQIHKLPKIQVPKQKPQFQLHDKIIEEVSEQDQQPSPGTIKKQITSNLQKTLIEEPKITIQLQSVHQISQNKINSNSERLFQNIRKSIINQPKKSPVLGRGDYKDTGSFRLVKKQSLDYVIKTHPKITDTNIKNTHPLPLKNHYLDEDRVRMINEQIIQIMEKRRAKLSPPKQTEQVQQLSNNNQRSRSSSFRVQKMNSKFYPELTTQRKKNNYQSERQFSFSDHKETKKVQITYRTSLSQMKQLINIKDKIVLSINISIPEILKHPLISNRHSRVQIFQIGCEVFRELGLPFDNLTVKKYSNCILIVNRNICVLWHFDGKVYLGGWQVQYLDEGFRHGIGLEWVPHRYTYYGEYSGNKRQGLGIMKKNGEVYVGLWSKGYKSGYGRTYLSNGQIIQKNKNMDNQYESDSETNNNYELNNYEPQFD